MRTFIKVPAKNLKLADVIRFGANMVGGETPNHAFPFSDCTVKQIKDGEITLFRPYVHTADFEYTGGVICTIGIEEITIPANETEYLLLESKTLK